MTDSGDQFGEVPAFLLAKSLVEATIASQCPDPEIQSRMFRALGKLLGVVDVTAKVTDGLVDGLAGMVEDWDEIERRALIVDLWFMTPFAPFEIKVAKAQRRQALIALAQELDVGDAVEQTERAVGDISAARLRQRAMKVGGTAVVGALVMSGAAFAAAPLLGAALGSAAGLSGAAATGHGLALLGGGAVAAGGSGVAGGTLAVTGTGAMAGTVLFGGGTGLYQLGAKQTELELQKLKVKFHVSVLQTQGQQRVAQRYATFLQRQINQLTDALVEEKKINDRRARRMSEMEKTLGQLEDALGWMNERLAGEQ